MSQIVKVCSKHGGLTIDQTRKDGKKFRCKACRIETNRKTYYKHREKRISTSIRWKRENRGDYNEWCRQDRKNNPEKYRRYEENYKKKNGNRKVTLEILRMYGITLEQYENMFLEQNNLCAICFNPETRLSRTKGKVARLVVDHCHETGKIRGLLCHACNQVIGHSRESKDILKNAIKYLNKYEIEK